MSEVPPQLSLQQRDKQILLPLLQCAVPAASADGRRCGSWDAESGLVVSADRGPGVGVSTLRAKSPGTLQ
jgi:hypothetical protein